ncbi:beta-galactosidase GalB [Roseateles asaccharophilus]|uniref:Beta-galactosidase n=1 Tax=Roseateles asaccharophilus TaxID=582607 RepID=A0ABU2AAW4_9BURK|nr:beta-galactosidase GalB [Roseateles asaccharophilus]MDR7334343.1 beta-galactosidase [Roseateles asaccharophilus]
MLGNPWRRVAAGLVLCVVAALPAVARERVDLAAGWRFHRGDPAGAQLAYDVRPEVKQSADGKVADARPDEAVRTQAGAQDRVLKPWVLPSANPFIKDPAKRHRRPDGHPGSEVAFVQASFDDSGWQSVTLPHDWAAAGPFLETGPYGGMGRLQTWGPVWYRRALDIPATDKGRSLFLDVDGAMSYATVWLNGKLVGGWPYGYNSFRLDLTPWAQPGGANQLVIRLDNPPESARWYPGAGLYRKVWLTKTDPVHVAHWGTTVTTPKVSPQEATVVVEVRVDNDGAATARVDVLTEIFELDADGRPAGKAVAAAWKPQLDVPAQGQGAATMSLRIAKPRLWGPRPQQQPHRYLAVTRVTGKAGMLDRYETPFGIRTLRFDANTGLHVNGQPVKLQGVNLHHDLGALGAAFNVRAAERQIEIMQAMGSNAIRMSHNPPAREFLELTDRMGVLVVDEIFDSWERKKTPLDFHLIFPDWHEADLRSMLRRDRNHPSVIMWSIGNEVGEQYTDKAGAAIARRLHEITREEDATRPTTTAMNFAKSDMPLPAEVDLISLNYQGEGIRQDPEFIGTDRIRTPPQYPNFHAKFPDKLILSSETASAFSSRGVYLFPVAPANSSITRDGRGGDSKALQVSGYELYSVDFGSSADKVFAALDAHPYVAGEFVWTGFDYLGEPTPYYAARSSYSGIVDLAGFPKDRFYLYQSRWRPELPMAHLLPHWTWPERVGQVTPVHAFTSGDEAELFLNGRSLGKRRKAQGQYRLRWDDVVYEPGELKLQAWRDGKPWATASVATAGPAAALSLQADRSAIAADGSDLSFVTLRITDKQGRTVPRADARIRFSIEGAGDIVATDNGDATSFEPFPSTTRKAFSGQALAIVRGRAGAPARLVVRAQADGLAPAEITIHTQETR